MKKLLLISFLLLGFSFTANSQNKYQGEVQIGYNFGVKDFDPDYANLSFINGIRFNKNLFAGIGVGLNTYAIFESGVDKEYALPIFINAKAYLPVSPQTDFFASLDCGYWFGISSNLKEVGGLMLTPSVGVCFDLGKSYGLNLSLGYNHQNWSADGPVSVNTGAIGLKVGFSF